MTAKVHSQPSVIEGCSAGSDAPILLSGKGKAGNDHDAGEHLLNLLQTLTSTEGEATFIRDIGLNFKLLETLESVRSHLCVFCRIVSVCMHAF